MAYEQKLKPLYIMEYLLQNSDEDHPVSAKDIIAYLDSEGISAERKSIYSDIDALKQFGLEIEQGAVGNKKGFYILNRKFEDNPYRLNNLCWLFLCCLVWMNLMKKKMIS